MKEGVIINVVVGGLIFIGILGFLLKGDSKKENTITEKNKTELTFNLDKYK